MSFKICFWKNVPGITSRFNDIIYSHPILPPSQDILVYFGGDVQDIQENMEQHADSKKYIEWSLQNTAQILTTNFPNKHVLIVRPSRMYVTRNAMFSCFDNFVPANKYGVPSFFPAHNALKHLKELIKSCLEHFETSNLNKDSIQFRIENMKLLLMGFSKGCVVLNQLLHEFHYHQHRPEPDIEINNFIKFIGSMWWLDGGHAGSKDTWITEKSILESFAKLKIDVHIHVTPYQIQDSHRPWIRKEENQFRSILQSMGIPVERTLHFAGKSRSLKLHFDLLKDIGNHSS